MKKYESQLPKRETLTESGISSPEGYIEKALKEYGFEEFPKSGITDIGLDRIVKTTMDIYVAEENLRPRKSKKGYLPVPKIKEIKPKNSGDLESQIMKEELGKVGKIAFKVITYSTIGINFAFPTIFRKSLEFAKKNRDRSYAEDPAGMIVIGPIFGVILENMRGYGTLASVNPKLGPYIIGTQIITNLASGIYEWKRNKKKEQAEERKNNSNYENENIITMSEGERPSHSYAITPKMIAREKCYKENDCKQCSNPQCGFSYLEKEEEYNNY